MNIWLIEVGEPLPIDPNKKRIMRIGLLAEYLYSRGHRVTWWASAFNHTLKKFRPNDGRPVVIDENFRLMLLEGPGYSKNVSLSRIYHNIKVARDFSRKAALENRPDIIHCCWPTPELGFAAAAFGKRGRVPVVLDVRDMWPDILAEAFPGITSFLAEPALFPYKLLSRKAFRDATALTGITPEFISFGLSKAGRRAGRDDVSFPLAYPENRVCAEEKKEAKTFWADLGVIPDDGAMKVCFVGTLGKRLEMDAVLQAADIIDDMNLPVDFVICGHGEDKDRLTDLARNKKNMRFPGWVGYSEIRELLDICAVGLAPYPKTKDFGTSIPNKIIEYLASGLPVVTSIGGVAEKMLVDNDCGIPYPNGDGMELANIIARLYHDQNRIKVMKEKARAQYRREYSAGPVYGSMCDYLERIAVNHA